MLGIDQRGNTVIFLCLGNGMECQSSLTRRFRTKNLSDSASWKSANSKGVIKRY